MNIPLISQLLAHRQPSKNLGFAALVLALLLPASAAFAQTTVVNSASAQPPAGVLNTNTGADGAGKVSASDTDSVSVPPKVTLVKTASSSNFIIGKTGQYYDITVTVASGPTSAAITIADNLPTGISLSGAPTKEASSTSNGVLSGCPATGTTLAGCQIAANASSGTIVIRVPVAVGSTATTGTNTATASGGGDPACNGTAACTSTTPPVAVGANAIVTTPDSGTVGGVAGGTVEANIVGDDTIGGNTATLGGSGNATVKQDPGSPAWPAYIQLNTTTGAVTVDPASPAGTYPVQYELCEVANPTNCKTETVTVTITPSISVVKTASASSFTVGATGQYYDITVTVASGPTSAAITIADNLPTGISLSGAPTKEASSTSNGVLSGCPATGTTLAGCQIAANASSGTIVIRVPVAVGSTATTGTNTATASGGGDPACNGTAACTSTTPPVAVGANAIVTTPDSGTVGGVAGGTVEANIVGDDTIGGNTATLGGSGNATVKQDPGSPAWPAYIQLNTTTGAVTVDPASPAGTYPVQYELCEVANPTNCKTETVTVTITPSISVVKTASASSFTVGATGQYYDITVTVASGPTSAAITIADNLPTGISLSGAPTKEASSTSNGVLSGCPATGTTLAGCQIAANASSGTIVIRVPVAVGSTATTGTNTATASGGGDPACNGTAACTSTTPPVAVGANAIVTTPDSGTVGGVAGGTVEANIVGDDTIGGNTATLGGSGNATVKQDPGSPAWPAYIQLNTTTGAVTVDPASPAGTYPVQYELCEVANPTNCKTETVTVTITPSISVVKTASASSFTVGATGQYYDITVTVASGPTSAAITIADNLPTGISLSGAPTKEASSTSNGVLSGCPATGTTLAGCQIAANASSGTIVIRVPVAVGSTATTGTNTATASGGGDPACNGTAACTSTTPPVAVGANAIVTTPDSGTVGGVAGGTVEANIVGDDTIGGNTATLGGSGNATVKQDPGSPAWPAYIQLNTTTGAVTVDPASPAGTYPVQYELCEVANPTNCKTETVTVTITPSISVVKTASASSFTVGATGQYYDITVTVASGPTSAAITIADNLPTGISLSGAPTKEASSTSNGVLSGCPATGTTLAGCQIAANASSGTIVIRVPVAVGSTATTGTNTATASGGGDPACNGTAACTSTTPPVAVGANAIVTTPDSGTVGGVAGGTVEANIVGDDTIGGNTATLGGSGNATVKQDPGSPAWPAYIQLNTTTGAVTVDPASPAGTYPVQYELCEVANPTNCKTETVTVTITPSISVVKTASASSFTVGATGQYYDITVTVASGPTSAAITIADNLPTGISLSGAPTKEASSTSNGVLSGCPATGTTLAGCQIAANASSGTIVIRVPVAVGSTATTGTNTATASGGGDPACNGTAACTSTTPPVAVGANAIVTTPDSGTVGGVAGGTVEANIVGDDTIGGNTATLGGSGNATVKQDPGSPAWPAYIQLNTTTGAVTVDPASPAGTYPVQYELCEVANPTNCKTETVTVTITPSISVVKTASASSFTVGATGQYYDITVTVASGPTSAAITIADNLPTGISLSGAPTKEASSTSNGVLSGCPATGTTLAGCQIAANASSGTIVIRVPVAVGSTATTGTNTATASGGGDPACNGTAACTSTTPPVAVGANAIVTTPDSGTVGGVAGGTVEANIVGDDTIGGNTATLGGSGNATVKQDPGSPAWPAYIQLNTTTGAVTVDPASPAGTYPVQYELCEVANPTNCKTETVTVTITPSISVVKTASASSFTVGATGQYYDITVTVASGPTSAAITIADNLPTGISLSGAPTKEASSTSNGVLSGCPATGTTLAGCQIAANASSGTIVIRVPVAVGSTATTGTNTATASGGGDPACNGTAACTSTTPPVAVGANAIVTTPDSGTVGGVAGGTVEANIVGDDTIGGNTATLGGSGNATVKQDPGSPAWPAYIQLNTTTGAVTVDPASPAGTYPVQYELCEVANPTNCKTETVTVTITPSISVVKTASASSFTVGATGQYYDITVTVASGPTSAAITIADNLPTGISLSGAPTKEASSTSNGVLSGCPATGTTLAGCQIAANASSGTIVIRVPVAVGSTATTGTNTATASGGGDPACNGTAACTSTTPPVAVGANAIVTTPDSGTVGGVAGGTVEANIVGDDTIGGNTATLGGSGNATVKQDPGSPAWPAYIQLNTTTGAVTVDPASPAGTYPVQYELCEVANPTNCKTETVTVTITPSISVVKTASASSFTVGATGQYYDITVTVASGPTSAAITIADNLPTGISLSGAPTKEASSTSNGVLSGCPATGTTLAGCQIAANASSGTIVIRVPVAVGSTATTGTNTATASGGGDPACNGTAACTSTTPPVAVGANAIVTTPDSGTVGGVAGGTVEANIVGDDTIGGNTATLGGSGNATVKQDPGSPAWPAYIQLNTTTGAVTVDPASPAGTYPVQYELCEVANPTNCKTETVTVTITPSISVVKTASASSFTVGATGQYYDITVTVASGPTSAAITIADNLPTGISLSGAPTKEASSTSNGVLSGCPATGTTLAGCQIAANASSGTIVIRVPVAVGSTATTGTNTATASGGGDPACNGTAACTSTTPPVAVGANAIVTTPDSGTVGGVAGGTVEANIVGDDTIGGNTATLGGSGNATVKQDPGSPAWPAYIQLNTTTGAVTVDPASPAGTYPVQYELCEVANPTNCKTETVTVTITPSISVVKTASASSFTVGATGQYYDITVTVASGPTSAAITIADNLPTGISLSGAPTKEASSTSNGVLSGCPATGTTLAGCQIAANASSGTIVIRVPVAVGSTATTGTNTATASGGGDPACNGTAACTSTTPPVAVGANAIVTTPDSGTVGGVAGGTVEANIVGDDTIGGNTATLGGSGNATVKQDPGSPAWPAYIQLNTTTGAVTVDPASPAGTYPVQYELCEVANPTNCKTETVTVTITPSISVVKTASASSFTVGATGQYYDITVTVASGPTSAAITIADNLPTGISLSGAPTKEASSTSNGVLSGCPATGTTLAGCQIAANASSGTIVIRVPVAVGSTATTGTNTATASGGGDPACNGTAACTSTTPPVAVGANAIVTTPDSGTVGGVAGGTVEANIVGDDTIGGNTATLGGSGNATVKQDPGSPAWPAYIQLNTTTGAVTVDPASPAGTYPVQYELCEVANPTNCKTETVTVTITPSISVVKTASASSFTVGATGQYYDITVTVASGPTSAAITIADNLPTGISLSGAPTKEASSTSNGVLSGCPATGTTLAGCQIAANASSGTIVIRVPVAVGSTATTGTNTATASGGGDPACNGTAACTSTTPPVAVGANAIVTTPDSGTVGGVAGGTVEANIVGDDTIGGNTATLGGSGNATVKQDPGSPAWPAYIQLNTTTGAVTVDPASPAGTYPVQYELCEVANPTNCKTETVTVTITPSISVVKTASASSFTVGATGQYYDITVTVASGPTSAAITIADNLPTGISLSGAPTKEASSTSNGVLSGCPATGTTLAGCQIAANASSGTIVIRVPVAVGSTATTGTNTATASGGGDPACNGTAACTSTTPPVAVGANAIVTTPDSGTVGGVAGGTVEANIVGDDTIGGNTATLGGSGNATVKQDPGSPAWPAYIQLNTTTGAVTVDPASPAGTYPVQYELCEVANPTNCKTETVTVTITPSISVVKTASASSFTVGATGQYYDITVTVASGPTSAAITIADNLPTGISLSGAPTKEASSTSNGVLSGCPATGTTLAGCQIAANASSGTIVIRVPVAVGSTATTGTNTATASGGGDPACNGTAACTSTTPPVSVGNAPLVATPDNFAVPNGATGNPNAGNAYDNDTLNGVAVTPSTITGTVVTPATPAQPGKPVPSLDPATGVVSVPAGTLAGNYTITYEICEQLNPSNCKQAKVTVPVGAGTIKANDETGSAPSIGGTAISNVYANDTLNGSMVNLADINATVTAPATPQNPGAPVPVLNPASGVVSVPAGTPVGTYTIGYQICEKLNTSNCSSAIATVVVTDGTLAANPDSGSVFSAAGGTPINNVVVNDSIKGTPATVGSTGSVDLTPVGTWPAGITLDTNTGAVTVPPNTPAGVYTLPYQICEKGNATNCAQSTATVTVKPSPLTTAPDAGSVPSATGGTAVPNVAANDQIGGNPAVIGSNAIVKTDPANPWPSQFHLDPATGKVTVDAGTPAGTYPLTYELCEKLNPSNCKLETVTVTVSNGTISAQPDAGTVPSTGGQAVANVTSNDQLNSNPVTLGAGGNSTVAATGTWPHGITLDPTTGAVNVPAGTPAGTYPLTYQLCEAATPSNCATATVTVMVDAGPRPTGVLSGKAYFDRNRDRVFDSGDIGLAGYWAVLSRVEANGVVTEVAQAQTGGDGKYQFNAVEVGGNYQISFRTPSKNAILGTPFNQSLGVVDQNYQVVPGFISTGVNKLVVAQAPNTPQQYGASITGITVYEGLNTIEQNLPLDPSGIVYDSVSRKPIVGAIVKLECDSTIAGNSCTSFNPAVHLQNNPSGEIPTDQYGLYEFWFKGAPSGVYVLSIKNPPPGYLAPQASAGGVAPAQGVLDMPGYSYPVQPQPEQPKVGVNGVGVSGLGGTPGTQYYLQLRFDFSTGAPEVVNNHIPLDPLNVGGRLQVEKTASTNTVEVGDSLQYTIRIKNNGASPVTGLTVTDEPPMGFSLIAGTLVVQNGGIKQGVVPTHTAGQRSFSLTIPGILPVGQEATVTYYMRAGVGAAQGSGTNTVRVGLPGQPNLASDKATVRVKGGVLGNDACLIGKVYVDNDGDRMQNNTAANPEPGVPGVKLVMETGAYAITDAEGKYSICPITPKTHVLKVDKKTLPTDACAGLVPSSNQNAGDGGSIFADVKNGELHRADFILATCSQKGLDAIKARRSAAPEASLQLDQEQSAQAQSGLPTAPTSSSVLSSSSNATRAQ